MLVAALGNTWAHNNVNFKTWLYFRFPSKEQLNLFHNRYMIIKCLRAEVMKLWLVGFCYINSFSLLHNTLTGTMASTCVCMFTDSKQNHVFRRLVFIFVIQSSWFINHHLTILCKFNYVMSLIIFQSRPTQYCMNGQFTLL